MKPVRFLLVLALVLCARSPVADACQQGSPCPHPRLSVKRPYVAKPGLYMRAAGTTFRSFTRSKVIAFLTAATWDPVLPSGATYSISIKPPPKLRFRDAAKRTTQSAQSDVRVVHIRRIEYREADKVTLIEVDGDRYALETCSAHKRMCLTLRNDLHFESEPTSTADPFGRY